MHKFCRKSAKVTDSPIPALCYEYDSLHESITSYRARSLRVLVAPASKTEFYQFVRTPGGFIYESLGSEGTKTIQSSPKCTLCAI